MLARVRAQFEAKCAARGLLYPWWIPLACLVGQFTTVVVALWMREALLTPEPVTLTLLLVLVGPAVQLGFDRWWPWWADNLGVMVAAVWLLATPVQGEPVFDVAAALLAWITAEATARDGLIKGAVVSLVSIAVLVGFALGPGVAAWPLHLVEIDIGFMVGAIMLWQMRALASEREARARAWREATLDERQRIAREIHDLVAHSLSVTLLHLTGARRTLRDVAAGDADAVGEVDAALADAEQVGRRAMADIRRTVSTLNSAGPAEGSDAVRRQVLPDVHSIPALVREVDAAGQPVTFHCTGDPAALAPATGLGLYRIAQESLANVCKHAGGAAARVCVEVDERVVRLVVSNPIIGALPRRGDGNGLAGMQARAEQLGAEFSAGPRNGNWVVEVVAPTGDVRACRFRPAPSAVVPDPFTPTTEAR